MIASEDKAFQYLGHYYGYLNAKENKAEEEMQSHIAGMDAIRGDVPKTIIEMCVME